jgi:putative glycosyltransferase
MKLAIVTTVYNGENTIGRFLSELDDVAESLEVEKPLHLAVVNDGSRDGSVEIILQAKLKNIKLNLLDLARNYGHHKAIFSGIQSLPLDFDYLVVIDSDLEENPKYLASLIATIEASKADVVLTYQGKRATGLINRSWAKLADFVFQIIFGKSYLKGICTLRLMKRYVATEFQNIGDLNPVLGVVHARLGFKTAAIEIEKTYKGTTEYTFSRRLRLFFRMIFSAPKSLSRLAIFAGISGLLGSVSSALWFVYYKLTMQDVVPGFTTLGLLITSIGGILVFMLSIAITLLVKILERINGGARTVVREIYEL